MSTRTPALVSFTYPVSVAFSDLCSGFWITLVVFILLLLSGCTVCFGRRRQRMSGATATPYSSEKPGLLSRFRRRRGAVV